MSRLLTRCTLVLACATVPALSAHAGTLTLTGWEYGSAGVVRMSLSPVPNVNLLAGALSGTVSGLTGKHADFNGKLVTYCVELTQWAPGWRSATSGYSVVSGLTYFGANHRGNQLGSFMTFVDTQSLFDVGDPRVANSGAVQLAIWNIVYDSDFTLAAGSMQESINTAYRDAATQLLGGWNLWSTSGGHSHYKVYVLHHAHYQDFLLLERVQPGTQHHAVPLPGTLALLVPAFAALALVRRRYARA